MACHQHSIKLPKGMRDLLFLCAHDFKHDFVEDTDRSGRALGEAGYHTDFPDGGGKSGAKGKGGSTTVTVAPEETIEVVKKRVREHETSGRSRSRVRKDVVSSQSTPPPSMLSQDAYTSPSLTLEQRREQQRAAAERRAAATEAPERIENPESFPLICYVYLIVQSYGDPDFTFDKVCDYLELLSNKVLSGGRGVTRSQPDNATDDPIRLSPRRGADRAARAPLGANTEQPTPRIVLEPTGKKWDSCLGLYKEWLQVTNIVQYNYLTYRTFDYSSATCNVPSENEKITWLIPHSEWREYEDPLGTAQTGAHEAYKSWEKMVHSNPKDMKKVINGIINEHNKERSAWGERRRLPPPPQPRRKKRRGDVPPPATLIRATRKIPIFTAYPDINITRKNWKQFKKFSEVLLTKWKDFIDEATPEMAEDSSGNPKFAAENDIFDRRNINRTPYVDNRMWTTFISHFNSDNLLQNKTKLQHGEPFSTSPPGGRINWNQYMIINNQAHLKNYKGYTRDAPGWKCPIPSIIDPQPVCGKIPPVGREKIGDEVGAAIWPADFCVKVSDSDNNYTITLDIKQQPSGQRQDGGMKYNYRTTITFNNGINKIIGNCLGDFTNGGSSILSAYRITKEFIDEKIKKKYGSIIDIEEFSKDQADEELRGIMGIFALKLMGDFSQELYSLCLSNRIPAPPAPSGAAAQAAGNPILFVANDRVSAARYILLKQFGIRGDGGSPLINEPGGGGFLSYGGKQNNYFLIMDVPPPPGGGGKKKKKVKKTKRKKTKTKTKTKRKSRKKKSRKKRK